MEQKKVGRLKAMVYRWLDLPDPLSGGDFWDNRPIGTTTEAGQAVSERSILSLSAAFACNRLISEAVGALPLKIYERTNQGRQAVDGHQLAHMLSNSPNSTTTSVQFWSAMTASMMLWGNAFARIGRVGPRIVSLEFIHPSRITPKRNEKGEIVAFIYRRSSLESHEISTADMLHVPAFSVDGRWGISAISYGTQVFGSGLAAGSQANNTFKNGLAPTVAYKMQHWLKDEQRTEMRSRIGEISGAVNAGEPALLEGGMEAQVIGINPKDAQLLESRGFSVEEICRWFGVDPSMIGHGTAVSNWGTGLEQKMLGFTTFTLQPILKRIEQAINKYLIADDRYYAEFIIEGLLRADSQGRSALYRAFVDTGIMTRDEVREKENLTKMGGNSAKQTVQMGFTTLESIGQNEAEDE